TRRLRPEHFAQHLKQAGGALAPLYVIAGDEPLPVIETGAALRAAARADGYTERRTVVMDARGDWNGLAGNAGSASLLGERRLLEIRLPTGKPGKTGADVLTRMAQQAADGVDAETLIVV